MVTPDCQKGPETEFGNLDESLNELEQRSAGRNLEALKLLPSAFSVIAPARPTGFADLTDQNCRQKTPFFFASVRFGVSKRYEGLMMTETKVEGVTDEQSWRLEAGDWAVSDFRKPLSWSRRVGEGENAQVQKVWREGSRPTWYADRDDPADSDDVGSVYDITESNEPLGFPTLDAALNQADRWKEAREG